MANGRHRSGSPHRSAARSDAQALPVESARPAGSPPAVRPSPTHRRPRTRTGAGPAAAPLLLAGAAVLAVAAGAGAQAAAGPEVAEDAEPAVLVLSADPAAVPNGAQARADRAGVRTQLTVPTRGPDAARRAAAEARAERAFRNETVSAAAVRRAAAEARRAAAEKRATAAAVARATASAEARTAAAERARAASEAQAARVIAATARAQALARTRAGAALGDVVAPVTGYRLSAGFGQPGDLWKHDHTGLDFACPAGTFVRAVADGTVVSAGWAGAYGWRTVVRHADGTETSYAHQFAQLVRSGQVTAGQILGVVGSTGNATGPHLHFEVRVGGVPVDPAAWLAARGVAV